MKSFIYKILNRVGIFILRKSIPNNDFCIISNDCYGGELYRWLNLPYNTPFIGLMIMIPCYLKLIKNLKHYLSYPLIFIDSSKYDEMNIFRQKNNLYPIALLNDIEIHFLHYHSQHDALNKWGKRIIRINYNNLFYKISIDKDYGEEIHLKEFEILPLQHKLSVSNKQYNFSSVNHKIPNNVLDATVTFRLSLKYVNLIGWLNKKGTNFNNLFQRIIGYILFFTLRRR